MSAPAQFVAFDLETTGLSPKTDQVLEVGAVRFDADLRRLDELEILVNPGQPIPLAIQRLCGITDRDVRDAAAPVEAIAQLADFCNDASLVAHGSAFDLTFCEALAPDAFARRAVFDSLELARILLPTAPSHSLPLLSVSLGLDHARPHRALSDARATHELFARLRDRGEGLPAAVLERMRRAAALMETPVATFFTEVVRGQGDPARRAWAGAVAAVPAAPPASEPSPSDVGVVAASVLARAGRAEGEGDDDGHELRDAQVQMARGVGQALERRRRLLVEAGTGVGKSLAYLVPLALYSRQGRRSVVATRTITLQEQLIGSDIPRAERLLGVPIPAVVLKGRNHQLSLRRWERFLHNLLAGDVPADLERLRFTLKVLAWLAETDTGDRAELHLTGADETLWRHVESDGGDCLGAACANWQDGRCFMVAARRAAEQASIVITNHALLLADAASGGHALGEHDALVIDEAHHLEDAATEQLGTTLRAADVLVVLDRLPAVVGPLRDVLQAARDGTLRLFGDVKGRIGEVLGADHSGNATVALTEELRAGHGHDVLVRSAVYAVQTWAAASRLLLTPGDEGLHLLEPALLPQPEQADEELRLAARALDEAAAAVGRVLLQPRPDHVGWLAIRAEQGELHEAPVSVAASLRDSIFDTAEAVVATSATLAVDGDFGFIAERLGLAGAEEMLLGSPYDYLEQALCVLPADVPPYDDPEHDRAVASLIGDIAERLGGSTLALFTGYSPLRRVHTLLGDRLEHSGIALLGQGLDGTRRQILSSFLANPRTVLLGTTSFWEGVDVPGDALRCVLIAKLPFAVPTDPLVRARTAGLRDPFGQYVLPQAVLRLRQGFGRLIRRGDDRGAVVLCDERLRSREYGDRFLAALPPSAVAVVPGEDVGDAVADFVLRRRLPEGAMRHDLARDSARRRMVDDEPA